MDLQTIIDTFLESSQDSTAAEVLGGLPPEPWSGQFAKCEVSAERWRMAGNAFFKKRAFETALDCYNAALCYAPPESEIALIYGCRSAVYFEMKKYGLAKENIKLALENGFPLEKIPRLQEREKKCNAFLAKASELFDINSFLKLSYPPKKSLPFIVGGLKLCRNVQFGRHVVTTKELKTGDIIAIESPAFVWPITLKGPICTNCSRTKYSSLLPCFHCTSVMFCSEECQEMEASRHFNRDFEGLNSSPIEKSLKMQRESIRVAGGVNQLFELLKDSEDKTIFDFDFSNPDDPMCDKNQLIALNGLCKNWKEVVEFKSDQQLLDISLMEESDSSQARKKMLKFAINQLDIYYVNSSIMQKGREGIYLFKSLLNHSCIPNVIPFNFGDKIALIVARPIKAGDQLFISYGALATVHPKPERKMMLMNYSFKCCCDACLKDYPRQFPKEDRRFIEPKFERVSPKEAIEKFKNNCQYIDKKAKKDWPCYEIARLIDHNNFLIQILADY